MPRGHVAPCGRCGLGRGGKARVRVGGGREGVFCADCTPIARAEAEARFAANARRWKRALYLATRRAS
jgi:hypothetical protein